MEYGLWHTAAYQEFSASGVLILVLMEYGLWLRRIRRADSLRWGLNPCSNGIWSLTRADDWKVFPTSVLILVLMEYGLWHKQRTSLSQPSEGLNPCSNGIWSLTRGSPSLNNQLVRLNPCSNGIWSLTLGNNHICDAVGPVLILVLMEYGLWLNVVQAIQSRTKVLILVLMEYGLWLQS